MTMCCGGACECRANNPSSNLPPTFFVQIWELGLVENGSEKIAQA